jgi:hypothetical protein
MVRKPEKQLRGENYMKLQNRFKLKSRYLTISVLGAMVFGITVNSVRSTLLAAGNRTESVTGPVSTVGNLQGRSVFELLLICAMVTIIGTSLGLILMRKISPETEIRAESRMTVETKN